MSDSVDADWYADYVLANSEPGGGAVILGPVAEWRAWWASCERRLRSERPKLCAAVGQGFVLDVRQVARSGISRQQIRTLLAHGDWSSPQRGMVAMIDPSRGTPDGLPDKWTVARRRHALACAAAAVRNPQFAVCGTSAGVLHGLPVLRVPIAPLLTTHPVLHTRRLRVAQAMSGITDWYGIAMTDAARSVVDIARLDRRGGLVAADAALREKLTDNVELGRAAARCSGWPGVRAAREIVALADERAESPLESVTRLALHDAGFSAPVPQHPINTTRRRRPYRVDLCWPDLWLILECDGRVKYVDATSDPRRQDERWREKRREIALERAGWKVERVTWVDVTSEWPTTCAYLQELFHRLVPRRG